MIQEISSKERIEEMLKKGKFSKKEKADNRTLMKFAGIFCKENHNGEKKIC